jgi:hypothetical protein
MKLLHLYRMERMRLRGLEVLDGKELGIAKCRVVEEGLFDSCFLAPV